MYQPLIHDIVERLKKLIFGFIKKNKDVDLMYTYYYFEDCEKIHDSNFWDTFLHKVFYEVDHPSLNKIRNIVELYEITSLTGYWFSFTGLEKGEDISIQISINYKCDWDQVAFSIAPTYFISIMELAKPRVKYKDISYYQNKPALELKSNALFYRDKSPEHRYGDMYIDNTKLTAELVNEVAKFIHNPNLYKFTINSIGNPTKHVLGRGIRLYKIPDITYNWQPILNKIKRKIDSFTCCNENIKNYIRYLKYDLSFEYSPDNYLEIYGTGQAFNYLWFEKIDDEDLCGAIFNPLPYQDRLNFEALNQVFATVDVYVTFFRHNFGSINNKVLNELIVYDLEAYHESYYGE